jgi:hypothetical protein
MDRKEKGSFFVLYARFAVMPKSSRNGAKWIDDDDTFRRRNFRNRACRRSPAGGCKGQVISGRTARVPAPVFRRGSDLGLPPPYAVDVSRIRAISWRSIGGRPSRGRERQRQWSWNPARCQRTTVLAARFSLIAGATASTTSCRMGSSRTTGAEPPNVLAEPLPYLLLDVPSNLANIPNSMKTLTVAVDPILSALPAFDASTVKNRFRDVAEQAPRARSPSAATAGRSL